MHALVEAQRRVSTKPRAMIVLFSIEGPMGSWVRWGSGLPGSEILSATPAATSQTDHRHRNERFVATAAP